MSAATRKIAPTLRDRIRSQLADLKMPGALEALDAVLATVDGGHASAAEAIERLLGAQITLRNNRRLQAAMRSSRPSRRSPTSTSASSHQSSGSRSRASTRSASSNDGRT